MKVFSNNVFDQNILTKAEIKQMVDYLIRSINLLEIESKTDEFELDLMTIKALIDFGIIDQDYNLKELEKILGGELFQDLVLKINKVKLLDISEITELKKFHLSSRLEEVRKNEMSNKPNMIDLFSGAGGLSLGLTEAGFRIVFANDIDKSALRTYSFNHPEVDGRNITIGDIEKISLNIGDYINEPIDLIVGGPPCQGFSNANRQRIIDDPRNNLYKYYVDVVHQVKPKYFIMENVRGMLKVADQVLTDINNTEIKYNVSYKVLNAKDIGIPQNRERLIFIGIREDVAADEKENANEIFEQINKKSFLSVSLIDAIQDLPPRKASRIKNSTKGDNVSGQIIDLNNNFTRSVYVDALNINNDNKLIYNHKARYNNDRDIEIFSRMQPGDNSDSPRISDIMPYKSRSHIFKDKYYRLLPYKYSKTITSHMKFDCNMYIHPFQARGLTPREAARIQSFPDDYFFLGSYTKTYQQIGNSVPPIMGKLIGEYFLKRK